MRHGQGNASDEYFTYPEIEKMKMWPVHPEIQSNDVVTILDLEIP
jgi:hypothetical protein